VCAGQEQTLSVETILDRAFAACETSIKGSRLRPTLVPLADFERLRLRLPSGSSGVSRALDYLSTFVPHLSLYQAFDCSVTSKLLAQSHVPRPDMDSLVSAVLAQEFSSAAMSQQPA
ncbi:MAG TPA: hypothetical protein VEQ63_09140, partial [Bryobacteraceae bacterium]|nr:hypothetical protein [Bryobacteraceae bacterium]